jgi:tellurite resistance protein TehA-like permease
VSRIVRSIRAICILYVVFGALTVLAAVGALLGHGGPDPPPAALAWIFLVLGSASAVSAIGVLRKRAWGIPMCRIISAFYLLSFPFGTIFGGYLLLNIGKVKSQFRRENEGDMVDRDTAA